VAKRLHRHFIGIERHPAYVEAAWGRLRAESAAPASAVRAPPTGRETPRIAFGSFVERGILKPGTQLTDKARHVAAEITAEGNLVSGAHRGSIHKVGAAVQNAPSCNGWTFWHFERDGALLALDVLRREDLGR
ncbi:MAG: site-specific DNA-methyltransferase, partial [Acidocella sp.]|nr:site-specific DNA-methyltransferase [Acidocella sp.]